MNYRILVSVALILYHVNSDPVSVIIHMSCDPTVGTWCGKLHVYEDDFDSTHDLMEALEFCSDIYHKTFNFAPKNLTGDFSDTYEIGFQLNHNCTTDGRVRCIKNLPRRDIPVKGNQTVEFWVTVYERGNDTACLPIF